MKTTISGEQVQEVKPGIKTSEFWKSALAHVVGLALIAFGVAKESEILITVGSVLIGLAGGTYSLSRGLAKKGTLIALAFSVMFLMGCGGPGYVRASAISGTVDRIVVRDKVYIEGDLLLTPLEKRAGIRDGILLKKTVDEAKSGE